GDAALSGITSGAANENQTLAVSIQSNTNPGLFDGPPVVDYTSPNTDGTITFTPAPDMAGDATITVRVSDGVDFVEQVFTVTVNAVADPLMITDQDDVSMNEDDAFTILVGHLSIQGADEPSAL